MKSFKLLLSLFVLCSATISGTSQEHSNYPSVPSDILRIGETNVGFWIDNSHYLITTRDKNGNSQIWSEEIVSGERSSLSEKPAMPADRGMGVLINYKQYIKGDVRNPVASPDGRYIAYTRNNDLYSFDTKDNTEKRLTFDGSSVIMNGWASWVYYEEILGRGSRYRSFWWSPDSRTIAFFRCDDTKVPVFPIYVADGQHGYLENTTYPKPGDDNPMVKLGFVQADGNSQAIWADFDSRDDQYFGTPFWTPDGSAIWLQWMNRDQNDYVLYAVNPTTGAKKSIYTEQQKTWIDWIEYPLFTKQGMLMVRDRGAWQQIYFLPYDGSALRCLTSGQNWGIRLIGADSEEKNIYFVARRENTTRQSIFSLSLSKKHKCQIAEYQTPIRLSPEGYHYATAQFSPDFKHFISSFHNASTPPQIGVFDNKGRCLRIISDTKGPAYDEKTMPRSEMLFLTTSDSLVLPAKVIWPAGMDPNRKYPVLVRIYGGPDSGTVLDSYSLLSPSYYYWATHDVIQVEMDHRGSGHCGKEGVDYMYRNLGYWEIKDYKQWIDLLREYPYVNPDKVGITGYSYGGYITALAVCTAGDYFQYGIAGAGVYDWRLYDSHYTERFMDTPKDNKEGYDKGSVILNCSNYANFGKKSILLLTHGTSDDNVHFQHSMQLVSELMKTNRHFEFMLYPGERHGYRDYKSIFSNGEDIAFWTRCLLGD